MPEPDAALRFEGDPGDSLLLTDLYQLNMLQAYRDAGMTATGRGFLVAAGLEQAVDFLERARFGEAELAWLGASGRFNRDLLDDLARWRFSGDVHAMPEGTVAFPRRADPAGHGTLAAGAADREPGHQPCALPDPDRLEGRAHGSGSTRQAPGGQTTLPIDTYDAEEGARKVVRLVPRLKEIGVLVRAVRLDSNYLRMPFNRCNLGSEQGLIDDPMLGQERDPLAPLQDVINDKGATNARCDAWAQVTRSVSLRLGDLED